MNSEQLSAADVMELTMTRQAIVERSQALWGSEISVVGSGDREQLDRALRRSAASHFTAP
ncbi:hypothetical protein [Pseudomonas sp. H2_H03]